MSQRNKFKLPSRFAPTRNFWVEQEKLLSKYHPLDLGGGHPDYPPPAHITEALAHVATSDCLLHQYTRDYGHPRLVSALSGLYSRLVGRSIDPNEEILVTVGGYEALFCGIFGHVDVGDEVVIIEPFFEGYESLVRAVGGVPKFVPLQPLNGDWVLPELESFFSSKTKVLILNNPNSPLGKVFKRHELEVLAQLCQKWNVLCLSDEVFEWIVYHPNKHTRIASLPGMWERTITIGSAGKTFSTTGWRIGWAYGPSNLLHNLKMVHQNSVYTGNTPMQEVVAIALEKELGRFGQEDCYFEVLPKELVVKRDFMVELLEEIGMKPVVPEGGYFIMARWSHVVFKGEKDKEFVEWMVKNVGVLGAPVSPCYSGKNEGYVRYCFVKSKEALEKAAVLMKTRLR